MKAFRYQFEKFGRAEDGAVTVDWVVLTAAVVGLISLAMAGLRGRDLGSDGNATLALLVATVHYEVLAHFCLVVAKGVALLEQTID